MPEQGRIERAGIVLADLPGFTLESSEGLSKSDQWRSALARLPGEPPESDSPWIWEELLHLLDDPLQILVAKNQRIVVALECFGFCLRWNRPADPRIGVSPQIVQFATETHELAFAFRVSFRPPPLVNRLLASREPCRDWERKLYMARVQRVIPSMHSTLRRAGIFRALSRMIRTALAIDETALRIAVRARWPGRTRVVSNDAYVLAAQHKHSLQRIAAETANLLPLVFYAYAEGEIESIDIGAIGEVKRALRRKEIPERVWTLLVNSDSTLLRTALRRADTDSPWQAVETYCRYLGQWGADRLVPEDMLRAIAAPHEPDDHGRVPIGGKGFLDHWFISAGLAEYWRREIGERADFIANEFLLVMDWVGTEMPVPDKNQRHAGWRWMLRSARLWAEWNKLKAKCSPYRWKSPLARLEEDDLIALSLDSPSALWEEGQTLRHCVVSYVAECSDGRSLVYSIRDRAGKSLATVLLKADDANRPWKVEVVRGFANSVVSDRLDAFASILGDGVNRAVKAQAATIDNNAATTIQGDRMGKGKRSRGIVEGK